MSGQPEVKITDRTFLDTPTPGMKTRVFRRPTDTSNSQRGVEISGVLGSGHIYTVAMEEAHVAWMLAEIRKL